MSGRNSRPKNKGPAASPGRLDQFGERMADESGTPPRGRAGKNDSC